MSLGKWKFHSLRSKLIFICLIMVSATSITTGMIGYNFAKDSLEDSGKNALKNTVRMAIEMIDLANEQVKAGNLSLEEAQEQVKTHFLGAKKTDGTRPGNKNITIGENDYLLVLDKKGMMLAHPKIEGKSGWKDKSSDGTFFTQEMIKKATTTGGGFTQYEWSLPTDPEKVAPKITYAELDPNWGWIVVSGSYLQDFNKGTVKLLSAIFICIGIALFIAAILVILYTNHLTKPINKMVQHADKVASGDLTVEPIKVNRKDEIGHLVEDFNRMIVNLKSLLKEVNQNSTHVHASASQLMEITEQATQATEQISSTIQEVSAGAAEVHNYIDDNSKIIHEMSLEIQKISSSAQGVSNTARSASEKSIEGDHHLQAVITQMNSINNKVEKLASVIRDLDEHSLEIGQFTGTIGYISEQTNLLALNASIEAARAGENGRGFAVVAEEIRKLAEQSSQSSRHISNLITTIQEETKKAIQSMEVAVQEVSEGLDYVNTAGESFKLIQLSVNDVTTQIQEVSAAAEQLSESTVKVVESSNLIANLSGEAAQSSQTISAAVEEQLASTEEIASSSVSLTEIANQSQKFIQKFKL